MRDKRKTRLTATMLTVVMIAGCIAGCGKKEAKEEVTTVAFVETTTTVTDEITVENAVDGGTETTLAGVTEEVPTDAGSEESYKKENNKNGTDKSDELNKNNNKNNNNKDKNNTNKNNANNSDKSPENTGEKSTVAISDKLLNVKRIVDSGDFVSYYMKPIFKGRELYSKDATMEDKWSLISYAYSLMSEDDYIGGGDNKVIAVGNKVYLVAEKAEIEELCKVYFGKVLSNDKIAASSRKVTESGNIHYINDQDIYYVSVADFLAERYRTSMVYAKSGKELVVSVDRYVSDYMNNKGEYLLGNAEVVLKYSEETRAGFVIADFVYTSYEKGNSEIQKARQTQKQKENKEKANSLMNTVSKDEALWNSIISLSSFMSEKGIKDWRVVSYVASALDNSSHDKNEISKVDKNGQAYIKVSKNMVSDIINVCGLQINVNQYNTINEIIGYYDKDKEEFYFVKQGDVDYSFKLGDCKLKMLIGDSGVAAEYRVEMNVNEINTSGIALGKYAVTVYPSEDNRFGFVISSSVYVKNQ